MRENHSVTEHEQDVDLRAQNVSLRDDDATCVSKTRMWKQGAHFQNKNANVREHAMGLCAQEVKVREQDMNLRDKDMIFAGKTT